MANRLEDILGSLQEEVAKHLLVKVRSGEISSQELSVAVRMLKDNNITVDVQPGDPEDLLAQSMSDMGDILPFSMSA